MYTEIIKFVLQNPKTVKVCGVLGIVLCMNLFIYNTGFDAGVNSVECPKIPPKIEICKPEMDTNKFLSKELSECRSSSADEVSAAIDKCRKDEHKACNEKIDKGIKTCVELNCELCETFDD